MKYTIQSFLVLLSVVFATALTSCSNDGLEASDHVQVINMQLEGGLQDYDASSTRARKNFPDGAKLLLRFGNDAYGTATYEAQSDGWKVALTGSLTTASSSSCELYYSPNPKSLSSNAMALDASTPFYSAQGVYSYTNDMLNVTATLAPATSRVRFRGTAGTTITLNGLSTYTGVDVSMPDAPSTSTSSLTLTVKDEYTDYVYGFFPDESRQLKLKVNGITYRRTFASYLFVNGKSGCIDIPSASSLGKWVEEEYEYVDLGLPSGTLWATTNIDAEAPEDYGDYFAWGETIGANGGRTNFSWDGYKWMDEDAATSARGAKWRSPSQYQLRELIDPLYTLCKWTSRKGVYGYEITSKTKSSTSIFLPAPGYHVFGNLSKQGSYGYYWSRDIGKSDSLAFVLGFKYDEIDVDTEPRYYGFSIRPIRLSSTDILVTKVSIATESRTLKVGDNLTLTASVTPSNAKSTKVYWKSSDTSVASISSDGIVNALRVGSTIISAVSTDGSGVADSCLVTVVAKENPGSESAHEYVDLGLPSGTLWATCNVGAENPEDAGLYFAWGETKGYTSDTSDGRSFDWSSYKWCNGSSSKMTKYSTSTSYWDSSLGTSPDQKTELAPEDDAATANWGSAWCMPTHAQQVELVNSSYTTTTWTTQNGVYGRKITSRTNGKSIFLPAAGYRYDGSLYNAGSYGYYWSRSLSSGYSYYAWVLFFNSGNVGTGGYYYRCLGRSVRPVRFSASE